MNFSVTLALILSLAASSLGQTTKTPDVSNRYIIKLRPGASLRNLRSLVRNFNTNLGKSYSQVTNEYTVFNGAAGRFDPDLIRQIRRNPDVEYVVPDGIARIVAEDPSEDDEVQNAPPSWGMTRVSQRKLNLSEGYAAPGAGGKGVDVYIVDTGVWDAHKDFEGRAKQIKSFITGEAEVDLNGHGTHCAGTIGSKTYGIAKKANLFGVKVLNSWGSGTWSGVISGIDFAANYTKGQDNPRVISMSLGGGKNQGVDDAVTGAAAKGVVVVSAAGNSAADTCQFSPAGAPGGIAVGSTDRTDRLSSFSNRGKCTFILAPGSDITSTWIGATNDKTSTISGTSMAAPHVSGVAAIYLSRNRNYASPQEVYDALKKASTPDAIQGLPAETANNLLFNFRKE